MNQHSSPRTDTRVDDSPEGSRPSSRSARKTASRLTSFLHDRLLFILIPLVGIGIVGALWGFAQLSDRLIHTMAIQEAKRFSHALTEFRSLYTSEVVARAASKGMEITHDYATREGAIPLPATLSILLGNRIAESDQGQMRLYSRYPFPWRKDGGPHDEFEREALAHLTQDPTQPFYRFETFEGRQVLRYATADLMREACVDCHNNHPDTPKSGWKVGDLRGVLEVIHPFDEAAAQISWDLQWLLIGILVLGGLGVGGLGLVISRLRRDSQTLEKRVADRTIELQEANQELEQQMSERRQAEQALRQEYAYTDRLLASISSILIGLDGQGKVTRWNGTAASTFGLAPREVLGKALAEVGIQWDWSQVERGIKKCLESHHPVRLDDLTYTQPSGKSGFLGLALTPLVRYEDHSSGVLVLGVDLSERKQLEAQLALAQKMESIGQMAAGIAHEINTPTQYVSDNLRFLQDGFTVIREVLDSYATLLHAVEAEAVSPELLRTVQSKMAEADVDYMTDEIPKALHQALEGAGRVATIVRAMKDFSHPGTTEKKPIDLNKAIESTMTVARNEWKYVADLVTDLDPALPPVPCLPGELNQVLLNLIINAAHAIGDVVSKDGGEKGTITLRTRANGD
ncbi:MAG: DUF3365 domain-containing protein, partial [Nitrospinae bacterium]|nr:DUF3365 domain-containing protein [Nitrospinota bacterium]